MRASLLLLALAFGPAAAQPSPIADALRDADGDRVPDAVGRRVTVAGRAAAASGALGPWPAAAPFYLQDATGGLAVSAPSVEVGAGDSLVATGRVAFDGGTARLDSAEVQIVPGVRRVPAPVPYSGSIPESVEGRLVRAEGRVVGLRETDEGRVLLLALDDLSLVAAVAAEGHPAPFPLGAYEPGDRLAVVGVAGQADAAPPYDESYRIYPRTAEDVTRAGVPEAAYRWAALAALALLALAVGVAVWLRLQVRRRVDALRASEDRYKTLVDRASDAVFVHDVDGQNVEMNRAARDLLGVFRDDTIGSMFDVVAPESLARARAHAAALGSTGHSRADLTVARLDGGRRLLEFESQVVALDGAERVLSLARDVEARRAYEQGLIAAREEAEEMARVKSAFLASMSHEIRTPLTAVIGFAELLMDEVDEDSRGLVQAIEAGGHRLLATLNSVLDLARLDSGREVLRPQALDLVGHVDQSVSMLRRLANERGLTLDVYAPSEMVPVHLDGGALDRIVTNLVGNAVKFTERGGVTVEIDADAESVSVRVIDTGIGIPDDFLPNLFTEFRQASEGDARSHEGTGLGLAITHRLVDLMGGTISVESTWGAGTAFTVVLPRGLSNGDGLPAEVEVATMRP